MATAELPVAEAGPCGHTSVEDKRIIGMSARVVAAWMASCRHQTSRICVAGLMSAFTPAAMQIGRLSVSAAIGSTIRS